jgi:hypothetical protein
MSVLNERIGWDLHLLLRNLRVCIVMNWSAPLHAKEQSFQQQKSTMSGVMNLQLFTKYNTLPDRCQHKYRKRGMRRLAA